MRHVSLEPLRIETNPSIQILNMDAWHVAPSSDLNL